MVLDITVQVTVSDTPIAGPCQNEMQDHGIKRLRYGIIRLSPVLNIEVNVTVSDTPIAGPYRNEMQGHRIKRLKYYRLAAGVTRKSESDDIWYPYRRTLQKRNPKSQNQNGSDIINNRTTYTISLSLVWDMKLKEIKCSYIKSLSLRLDIQSKFTVSDTL